MQKQLSQGDIAPDFTLLDQNGVTHTLSSYKGKRVLIYFYPKDDTPGCTTEACSFRDGYEELTKTGLAVLGVSPDSTKSHKKFAEKYSLPFPLLSDEGHLVAEAYGVWQKKKFMGREYMGVARSSFLVDKNGSIEKVYSEVKPATHVSEVQRDLEK